MATICLPLKIALIAKLSLLGMEFQYSCSQNGEFAAKGAEPGMSRQMSKDDLFIIMALWMERCPLSAGDSPDTEATDLSGDKEPKEGAEVGQKLKINEQITSKSQKMGARDHAEHEAGTNESNKKSQKNKSSEQAKKMPSKETKGHQKTGKFRTPMKSDRKIEKNEKAATSKEVTKPGSPGKARQGNKLNEPAKTGQTKVNKQIDVVQGRTRSEYRDASQGTETSKRTETGKEEDTDEPAMASQKPEVSAQSTSRSEEKEARAETAHKTEEGAQATTNQKNPASETAKRQKTFMVCRPGEAGQEEGTPGEPVGGTDQEADGTSETSPDVETSGQADQGGEAGESGQEMVTGEPVLTVQKPRTTEQSKNSQRKKLGELTKGGLRKAASKQDVAARGRKTSEKVKTEENREKDESVKTAKESETNQQAQTSLKNESIKSNEMNAGNEEAQTSDSPQPSSNTTNTATKAQKSGTSEQGKKSQKKKTDESTKAGQKKVARKQVETGQEGQTSGSAEDDQREETNEAGKVNQDTEASEELGEINGHEGEISAKVQTTSKDTNASGKSAQKPRKGNPGENIQKKKKPNELVKTGQKKMARTKVETGQRSETNKATEEDQETEMSEADNTDQNIRASEAETDQARSTSGAAQAGPKATKTTPGKVAQTKSGTSERQAGKGQKKEPREPAKSGRAKTDSKQGGASQEGGKPEPADSIQQDENEDESGPTRKGQEMDTGEPTGHEVETGESEAKTRESPPAVRKEKTKEQPKTDEKKTGRAQDKTARKTETIKHAQAEKETVTIETAYTDRERMGRKEVEAGPKREKNETTRTGQNTDTRDAVENCKEGEKSRTTEPSQGVKTPQRVHKAGAVFVDSSNRIVAMDCGRRWQDKQTGLSMDQHAAARVVTKYPDKVKGCTVFMSRKPCFSCVKLLVQAGVLCIRFLPLQPEAPADGSCSELENAVRTENLVRVFPVGLSVHLPELDEQENPDGEECWADEWLDNLLVMQEGSEEAIMRCGGLPDPDVTWRMGKRLVRIGQWVRKVTSRGEPANDGKFRSFQEAATLPDAINQALFLHMSRMSLIVAEGSDDPVDKVGVVLLMNNEIVSVGLSGYPSRPVFIDFPCQSQSKIAPGKRYQFLNIHAEQNALLSRNTREISGERVLAFVTCPPCDECLPLLFGAGVKKLVLPMSEQELQRGRQGKELFLSLYQNGHITVFGLV